jgi:hypothetical protein
VAGYKHVAPPALSIQARNDEFAWPCATEFARQLGALRKQVSAQRALLAELDALIVTLQDRGFRVDL